jgi:electron transfer flavoprotein alpha subunit
MLSIWVYADLDAGRLQPSTLELLSRARELGEAHVVVLGHAAAAAVDDLGRHGAATVRLCPDPVFADHPVEPAVDTLAALMDHGRPDVLLFSATASARDVAGRLAARRGVGVIANAIEVSVESGVVKARVPYFGGEKVATYRANARPSIVTVRARSYEATETGGSAEVIEVQATVGARSRRTRTIDRRVDDGGLLRLEDASVVVAGGRGLGSPENFKLVEDLASVLGGAAGATRAIVDAGWVPYALQIGQTGKIVRPGVYIAVGISGAIQHTVGMKDAKLIVAINSDPDAPILKIADLGVVGDALTILPALTDAIEARRAG